MAIYEYASILSFSNAGTPLRVHARRSTAKNGYTRKSVPAFEMDKK